jgi:hypothetical protein
MKMALNKEGHRNSFIETIITIPWNTDGNYLQNGQLACPCDGLLSTKGKPRVAHVLQISETNLGGCRSGGS